MFITDRESVKEVIRILQRKHCVYDGYGFTNGDSNPPPFCDCKFGMTKNSHSHGEKNGCPELRCVVELLEAMTDEEFTKILKRGGHTPHDKGGK